MNEEITLSFICERARIAQLVSWICTGALLSGAAACSAA